MVLIPMPEATTRLAALRSGQVDWIEAPPPDTVPGLKRAGFEIVTGSYKVLRTLKNGASVKVDNTAAKKDDEKS